MTPPAAPQVRFSSVEGMAIVRKDTLPLEAVVRPDMARATAEASLFMVPGMALVLGLFTRWAQTHAGFPGSAYVGLLLFGIGLTAFLIAVVAYAGTSFGFLATDGGLLYFERALRRASVLQYGVPWESMHDPKVVSRWFSGILVRSLEVEIHLDRKQAKALFADPRCPFRGRLPVDVAKRLGSV